MGRRDVMSADRRAGRVPPCGEGRAASSCGAPKKTSPGCWLLAAGSWLLAAGDCLLPPAAACCLLAGYWLCLRLLWLLWLLWLWLWRPPW